MKACIMCGGTGTRLRPLTFERPKPNIPILNKPSVAHLVDHLSIEGFNEIVITLKYLGENIEQYLGDGSMFGVNVEYAYEEEKLGTAGGVKNADEFLRGSPFLVLGGDHVMNLNLREFYRFHESHDGLVSIGLLCIDDPRPFGIVDMDVNNILHRFKEKPGPGEIFSNLASTGIYVCDSEVLDWIPSNREYDFAHDLFPHILDEGEKIYGFLVRGHWTDVGNPAAYRQACRWKLENLPGTEIAGHFYMQETRIKGPVNIGHDVSMGSNTSVVGPVMIGENVKIGNDVLIGPYTTIGKNCVIKDQARILSSYLYNDVIIGENSSASGVIIDDRTSIGANCVIENNSVIGPRVVIRDNVTVHSGSRIWPDLVVKEGTVVREDLINESYETSTKGS